MKRVPRILLFLLLSVILLVSCKPKPVDPKSQTRLLLGTVCTITLYDKSDNTEFDLAFDRIDEIERLMSSHLDDSELARVNQASGIQPVVVSGETFAVIKLALEIAELSGGAFDPTIGPLVKLWDISGANNVPEDGEIQSLLPLVDYKLVVLDEGASSVYLPIQGMALDLGGIAKGWAADEAGKVLSGHKGIVNLGGNVLVLDSKPDESPWRIGIQDPDTSRGSYIGIVELVDQTLVTSGPYERFFEHEGKIYHHILDTKTGYPVASPLTSVSIITDRSVIADGLSTAVYALGLEKGLELIDRLDGVEAIFLTKDRSVYASEGILDGSIAFKITHPEYTIVSR
ncbi:MAG TPA: FAD:protein FMN transferase [Sphaerochaeta sp.]|nr:FAD:protein FMN transferase [Sphaerochaeta sp.]HQB05646.1 FAD:protein FMN transferase [Sphaerochaeta sp.]